MDIKLYILNTATNINYEFSNLCEGQINFSSSRKGSPSSLTFKIARNILIKEKIFFEEGDFVSLIVNDFKMFKGRIFSKSRKKEQVITITAYDQLKYLNNKKTYEYTYKKASDVLKMIANDFKLEIGEIEDSQYVISKMREEDETLFDIILNAIDITNINIGKLFVLFDDFGKLSLKNIENMFIPLVISDDGNIIDFNYKTDIESDTYNLVKLYQGNKETGKRDIYISQDTENQNKWGILQYYSEVPEIYNSAQIKQIADMILKQKNRIKNSLSIECICNDQGEEKIRGGSIIVVDINDLGDKSAFSLFVVEKVEHVFSNSQHNINIEISEWNN